MGTRTMFESPMRLVSSISVLLGLLTAAPLAAQSPGDVLRGDFPQLAALFDAFDVTHGALFERLAEITASPASQDGQDQLREMLMMQANMTMEQMMVMGAGDMDMPGMAMGPFGELEMGALMQLTEHTRAEHTASAADNAFSNSEPLTPRTAAVIQRGRDFEARIYDIYADNGITDKNAAVDAAVADYLSEPDLAVPSWAKSPSILYGHPFASAFQTGYPSLSGLIWASQWLQLAALEPLMLGGSGSTVAAGVETTIERFWSKVDGMQGMSMLPTEFPAAPAISPVLYTRHPEAAIIIDNLNHLETVIADVLVDPDVQDRSGSIDGAVAEYTDPESNLAADQMEYVLSALRNGIFNQGGPALGELDDSERNRSRMQMEMRGHMVMPGMN